MLVLIIIFLRKLADSEYALQYKESMRVKRADDSGFGQEIELSPKISPESVCRKCCVKPGRLENQEGWQRAGDQHSGRKGSFRTPKPGA